MNPEGGSKERLSRMQKEIIKALKELEKFERYYYSVKKFVWEKYGSHKNYFVRGDQSSTYPEGFLVSFSKSLRNLEKKGYIKVSMKPGRSLIRKWRYKTCRGKKPKITDNEFYKSTFNMIEDYACDGCPIVNEENEDIRIFYYDEKYGRCNFLIERTSWQPSYHAKEHIDGIELTEKGEKYRELTSIEKRIHNIILQILNGKYTREEIFYDQVVVDNLYLILEKKIKGMDGDRLWEKMWSEIRYLEDKGELNFIEGDEF